MSDENKKPVSEEDKKELTQEVALDLSEDEDTDDFDFGGLPNDQPFKRNLGCGG